METLHTAAGFLKTRGGKRLVRGMFTVCVHTFLALFITKLKKGTEPDGKS